MAVSLQQPAPFAGLLAPLLAVLLAVPGPAQEDGPVRDAARTIERYVEYLERRPYHGSAFDKLVETALEARGFAGLLTTLEERLEPDGEDRAAAVLLARLYAFSGRYADALALLEGPALEDAADPDLQRLLGGLHLANRDPARALECFDRALAGELADPLALAELQRGQGEAALALGRRDLAVEAFRAAGGGPPESYHARLEAAALLRLHGLHEAAAGEYAAAAELAGDDPARRCRALGELGALQELLGRDGEALETYGRALALMGRGNWQRGDLETRLLAIHGRRGDLDVLVERLRGEVREAPSDGQAYALLARALAAAGRPAEAREALAAGLEALPSDLELGRLLLEHLREARGRGDPEVTLDALLALYQRLLARHPQELELAIELGEVLAGEGRLEQARERWESAAARRPGDLALARRLAGLYARAGLVDDAVRQRERILELEPRDVASYGELARYLLDVGRGEAVAPLLVRAGEAVADDPRRLAELARLWLEQGELERGARVLEAALALDRAAPGGGGAEALHRARELADVLAELGRTDEALVHLRTVVGRSRDARERQGALGEFLRLAGESGRLAALLQSELEAVRGPGPAVAAHLILAAYFEESPEPRDARPHLEALCAVDWLERDARARLARLHERSGDVEAALAELRVLADRTPAERARWLLEEARLLLAQRDRRGALARFAEVLRDAPDDPEALREVALAYERLALLDEARGALQQAVRVRPEDGPTRIDLARVLLQLGLPERAHEELIVVLRAPAGSGESLHDEARGLWYRFLEREGRVELEIRAQRARLEENPRDQEAALALLDLYERRGERAAAYAVLADLVALQPSNPELLHRQAASLLALDRPEEALEVYAQLWELSAPDRELAAERMTSISIQLGLADQPDRLAPGTRVDPLKLASMFELQGQPERAEEALAEAVAAHPGDRRPRLRLAQLYGRLGSSHDAARTYEQLIELEGDRWGTLLALGRLRHQLGEPELAVEAGRRLFELLGEEPAAAAPDPPGSGVAALEHRLIRERERTRARLLESAVEYFTSLELQDELRAVIVERSRAQPRDETLYRQALALLLESEGGDARLALELTDDLCEEARSAERAPPGWTPDGWLAFLERSRMRCFAASRELSGERSAELEALFETGAGSAAEHLERARLEHLRGFKRSARRALERAAELYPEDARLAAGLGEELAAADSPGEAADRLGRALEQLAAEPPRELPPDPEPPATSAAAGTFTLSRSAAGFVSVGADVEPPAEVPATTLGWGPGERLAPRAIRRMRTECLLEAERFDEARAELELLGAEGLEERADALAFLGLARGFAARGLAEDARLAHERLAAAAPEGSRPPREWESAGDPWYQARVALAATLLADGEVEAAYDQARPAAVGGVLPTFAAEILMDAKSRIVLQEACERTRAAYRRIARPDGAYLRATRVLAEARYAAGDLDDAGALLEELAEAFPSEPALGRARARVLEELGELESAAALHRELLEAKRAGAADSAEGDGWPGPPLLLGHPATGTLRVGSVAGSVVHASGEPDWDRLTWLLDPPGTESGRRLGPHYAALLRLHLDRGDAAAVLALLDEMAADGGILFDREAVEAIAGRLGDTDLGTERLAVLERLHGIAPESSAVAIELGRSLLLAFELERARAVLRRLLHRENLAVELRAEVGEQLARVEAYRQALDPAALEPLRARLERVPGDVELLLELGTRLLEAGRVEEALARAREAEAGLASRRELRTPVRALLFDALRAAGLDGELEEELQREMERPGRWHLRERLAVEVADRLCARGEDEEAVELLWDLAKNRGPSRRAALVREIATWFEDRGDSGGAAGMLEHLSGFFRTSDEDLLDLRLELARHELAAGEPGAAMARLEVLWEAAGNAAERLEALELAGAVVARDPDPRLPAGTLGGAFARAAWALGRGERDAIRAALGELAASGEELLAPHLLLVRLELEAGDPAAALEHLAELGRRGLGRPEVDAGTFPTPDGEVLTEDWARSREALALALLGRSEEAEQRWAELERGGDGSRAWVAAEALARAGEPGRAFDLVALHQPEIGASRPVAELIPALLRLHELADAAGRPRERHALEELLGKAASLAAGEPAAWQTILLHRAGRIRREGGQPVVLGLLEQDAQGGNLSPPFLWLRALLAFDVGDLDEAESALQALCQQPTAGPDEDAILAEQLLVRGDWERARALLGSEDGGAVPASGQAHLRAVLTRLHLVQGGGASDPEVLGAWLGGPVDVGVPGTLGTFLAAEGRHGQARPLLELGVSLRPRELGPRRVLARSLAAAGEPDGALEALFGHLEHDPSWAYSGAALDLARGLARATGGEERLRAGLERDPAEPGALFRAAALDLAAGRAEDATGGLARLAAERPEDPVPWVGLARALELAGRSGEALAALEEAWELAAAANARSGLWNAELARLRVALGELELRTGGDAAAAWSRALPGRHFAAPDLEPWRLGESADARVARLLLERGREREALPYLRRLCLRYADPREYVRFARTLARAGEGERARELLWRWVQGAPDPWGPGADGGRSPLAGWRAREAVGALYALAREADDVEAFRRRLDAALVASPHGSPDPQVLLGRLEVLAGEGAWELLLVDLAALPEPWAAGPDALLLKARAREALGDHGLAVGLWRELYYRAAAQSLITAATGPEATVFGSLAVTGVPPALRPQGPGSEVGAGPVHLAAGGEALARLRRKRMASLARSGKQAGALQLESQEENLGVLSSEPLDLAILQAYLDAGAEQAARRWTAEGLAAAPERAAEVHGRWAAWLVSRERPDEARPAAQAALQALDLRLLADPESTETRLQRSRLLRWAGEPQGALEVAREARAARPLEPAPRVAAGWALLELDRPAEALDELRGARDLAAVAGWGTGCSGWPCGDSSCGDRPCGELLYGEALALARLGRPAEAAPLLRRALVAAPRSPAAPAARAAMP